MENHFSKKSILAASFILWLIISGGYIYASLISMRQFNEREPAIRAEMDKRAGELISSINNESFRADFKEDLDSKSIVSHSMSGTPLFSRLICKFDLFYYNFEAGRGFYVVQGMNSLSDREYIIYDAATKQRLATFGFSNQWEEYKKYVLELSGGNVNL